MRSPLRIHHCATRRILRGLPGLILAGALLGAGAGRAADRIRAEEERLIQVLQSGATVAERDAACARLQRIGTERAVPALAALLGDPALGHSARFALETLPGAAAGGALIDALAATKGRERLGVVASLAVRREAAAVPELVRLLTVSAGEADRAERDELAAAAAAALGALEDDAALAALERAQEAPAATVRRAIVDALLAQGERRLQRNDHATATRVFRDIFARELRPATKAAAYRGLLLSAGAGGLDRWRAALLGQPGPEQTAALQVTAELPWPGVGQVLAEVVPVVPPDRQRALLDAWLRRPDAPSRARVLPLLESAEAGLRLAAVQALGRVGGAEDVGRLLEWAAGSGLEQRAAREALTHLRDADTAARLIEHLGDRRNPVRAEAARALGERGDRAAVGALLTGARDENDDLRRAALRALVLVVDEGQVEALVRLLAAAPDEARRGEAGRALALVLERLQPRAGSPALIPLLRELASGTPATRAALWSAGSAVVAPEFAAVWRQALHDRDPRVRAAAVRAASLTHDVDLLPDLLAIACRDENEEFREFATKACVRLAGRRGGKGALAERLELFRALAAARPTPVQQRLVLAGLAAGRTAAELELAERFLVEADVWAEAAAAVVKIAPRVPDAAAALAALHAVGAAAVGAELRGEIDAARANVEARARYLTSWQVSPPVRMADAEAERLLEAEFPPELPTADFRPGQDWLAHWTPLAVGLDSRNPMVLRGGGPEAFGVVYAYTWLWSPVAQRARFEVWHEGGAKVWLGDTLVLSSSDDIGLPPRAGVAAELALAEGWTLLRVKLAQPAKAWSFAVRVSGREGAPLPGLVADASGGWGN